MIYRRFVEQVCHERNRTMSLFKMPVTVLLQQPYLLHSFRQTATEFAVQCIMPLKDYYVAGWWARKILGSKDDMMADLNGICAGALEKILPKNLCPS
jgi:hypothetical protein